MDHGSEIFGYTGYWGSATSSIDWCETNYEYSHYIAELFNTFSSFAMVLIGEFGAWLHPKSEYRYRCAFRLIAIVGWGSLLFHGTLKYETQMLDELPMCWAASMIFYCLIKNMYPKVGRWFPILLSLYAVLVTLLVSLSSGQLQFYLFHITFGSLEVVDLLIILAIYLKKRQDSATIKRLFEVSIGLYLIAVFIWGTDLAFCKYLNGQVASAMGNLTVLPFNPQLHAFWHILVSAGLYHLCLLILVYRQETIGHKARLNYLIHIIPYVSWDEHPKSKRT